MQMKLDQVLKLFNGLKALAQIEAVYFWPTNPWIVRLKWTHLISRSILKQIKLSVDNVVRANTQNTGNFLFEKTRSKLFIDY